MSIKEWAINRGAAFAPNCTIWQLTDDEVRDMVLPRII